MIKQKIKDNKLLRNLYLLYYYYRNRNVTIWGGRELSFEIKNSINLYGAKGEKSILVKTFLDIIDCYIKYGATPQEYFLFGFKNKSDERRSEFLTNQYKDRKMIETVGFAENWDLLECKDLFYDKFKDYFKRDVCVVKDNSNKADFDEFCETHEICIVKPLNGQCGKGVEIKRTLELNFDNLINNNYGWILEELISQDVEMSKWNQTSVNTVRLPCFVNKNGFKVLKPFIRLGRRGSIVDNGNAGGVFAVINEKTGVIETCGMDLKGNKYESHPDSGMPFKGTTIPRWSELLDFAKEIHTEISYYPYVGWDFALTSSGWVLVEGNWGQFLSEFVDQEGIKNKFNSLLLGEC